MDKNIRAIIDSLMIVARENLSQQDEFSPFGVAIKSDYEAVVLIPDESIDGAEADLASVEGYLQEHIAEYQTIGTATMSRVEAEDGSEFDAVYMAVEDVSGKAMEVIVPYQSQRAAYAYADEIAIPSQAEFFPGRGPHW